MELNELINLAILIGGFIISTLTLMYNSYRKAQSLKSKMKKKSIRQKITVLNNLLNNIIADVDRKNI